MKEKESVEQGKPELPQTDNPGNRYIRELAAAQAEQTARQNVPREKQTLNWMPVAQSNFDKLQQTTEALKNCEASAKQLAEALRDIRNALDAPHRFNLGDALLNSREVLAQWEPGQ